jgi:prepilin-type N-terminal cleavage/methylation domain-containing protein
VPPLRLPPRRRPPAGFTLIEIVLVLVVMAIAGVLAIPALQPLLQSVRGEAAARRTASFLDEVRRRAVMERRELRVRCRPEERRLVVLAAGAEKDPVTFRIPERAELVSCRPEEVRYFPQGYATGIALLLRDEHHQEHSVTVGSFTGLARVERVP